MANFTWSGARIGTAQGPGDAAAVTVKDALRADTLINTLCGGIGGLDPPTDPADLTTRPEIDVPGGQSYTTGRIIRAFSSFQIPETAAPHIVVSVFTRNTEPQVGGRVGDLQIAVLLIIETPHRILPDDEASLDGLLDHIEKVIGSDRHCLLLENAYGGVQLVKRQVDFALNTIGENLLDNEKILNSFQMLISYELSANQRANVPVRIRVSCKSTRSHSPRGARAPLSQRCPRGCPC